LKVKLENCYTYYYYCFRTGPKKGADPDDDTMEIGELKLALRAMRTAFAFAMPWNYSVLALEGFFLQNNYCFQDLANVDKKAAILTKFIDYVLLQNGDRWRDSEPFLTTGRFLTCYHIKT
jgi:hypothetical protein